MMIPTRIPSESQGRRICRSAISTSPGGRSNFSLATYCTVTLAGGAGIAAGCAGKG
jgi:hypothetical protein